MENVKPAHIDNRNRDFYPNQGNPFVPPPVCQRPSVVPWTRNELLLNDSCLRAQAGVTPLDINIHEVYEYGREHIVTRSRLCWP